MDIISLWRRRLCYLIEWSCLGTAASDWGLAVVENVFVVIVTYFFAVYNPPGAIAPWKFNHPLADIDGLETIGISWGWWAVPGVRTCDSCCLGGSEKVDCLPLCECIRFLLCRLVLFLGDLVIVVSSELVHSSPVVQTMNGLLITLSLYCYTHNTV